MNSPPLFGSYDHGNNWTNATGPGNGTHFLAREPGIYRYTWQAGLAAASSIVGNCRIWKNATYDSREKNGLTTGEVVQQGVPFQLVPRADVDLGGIAQNFAGICVVTGLVELLEGDRISPEFWTNDPGGIVLLGSNDTGNDNLVTFMDVKLELAQ
jgi:hypothetical protein